MLKVTPEIADEIKHMYARDIGGPTIAQVAGISEATVWRVLRRCGIATRPRGSKGTKCVECGKKTGNARRCPPHAKIRNAEMNREIQRKRKNVKNPLAESGESFEDRGYFGPTRMEWRPRKSGVYGPTVMQGEQGLT